MSWQSTCLALALDATSLGDRFTILSISVIYRGQAIPVAWEGLARQCAAPLEAGVDRLAPGLRRLGPVRLDDDRDDRPRLVCPLDLPGDRGLELAPRDADHAPKQVPQGPIEEGCAGDGASPAGGGRWQGRGVAFPKKPERRLECTLMACWEEGYDEPWFLVTDLDPDQAEGLWYGMRSWIEGGFKLLKSGGWQWQATRMTDPDRVERLWLVLAVATRYVLAVGGEADAAEFADAAVPEPAVRPVPSATASRPARMRVGGPRHGVAVPRVDRLPPTSRGGGGPGRRSAWSACSDKAWRCC